MLSGFEASEYEPAAPRCTRHPFAARERLFRDRPLRYAVAMNRRASSAVMLAVLAMPFGLTMLLVGCCASSGQRRPLETMTHCQMAAMLIEGDPVSQDDATPPRQSTDEIKVRGLLAKLAMLSTPESVTGSETDVPIALRRRDRISHGALRGESDVGLCSLLQTYRV